MSHDALAASLVSLLGQMRGESRMSLETFLKAAELEYGGVLRIQAPCSVRKRPRYEIGFQSERYGDII